MRLIINDILTQSDKDMIERGLGSSLLPEFDIDNLAALKDTLSERGRHFFDCLAWLIRNKRIEIKVISPVGDEGVAHTKCGVFCDGISKVGFDGSVNFSKTAFVDNKESLTACCSWDNEIERAKIIDIEEEFDKTFSGKDETVRYIDAKKIKTRICDTFPDKDIAKLLKDEYEIIEHTDKDALPPTVRASLIKAGQRIQKAIETLRKKDEEAKQQAAQAPVDPNTPQFPYPTGPKDYQEQAFNEWKTTQKGLFAMATGTGKTITSLNCLYEIYKRKGYYKAIILVPTVTLVNQWAEECHKFNFLQTVRVCSGNTKWKNEIETLKMAESVEKSDAPVSYVIICTYASYSRINVFTALNEFSKTQLLFIADEAHNMGSVGILTKIEGIPYQRRIGLSATPERQFDDVGNETIRKFFGAEKRYTFEYDMNTAIHGPNPVLCQYDYFPHIVHLSEEEMREYMKISVKLARLYLYNSNSFPEDNDHIKTLLLMRKAIIHKAVNKLEVFRQIIEERLAEKGNLKYTLVYVPEGNIVDEFDCEIFSQSDSLPEDQETVHLIDRYTAVIRDAGKSVTVRQFTSKSSERGQMLEDFAMGRLEVLTSMKCLDEGVDVPRSEMAIFCASTGNPRQFIQRRGRILRKHPDKKKAIIHDLVVVPEIVEGMESFEMERKLLGAELRRVKNFALLSENANSTIMELDKILDYYKLSLFD